jgi:hypothetical protein
VPVIAGQKQLGDFHARAFLLHGAGMNHYMSGD